MCSRTVFIAREGYWVKWPLGWNWDKVREWIKVGALVVIAFSMLQITSLMFQIAGLLRGIDSEISMIETNLSGMSSYMGSMDVSLDFIFKVLNRP